jgi:hypothetical protein
MDLQFRKQMNTMQELLRMKDAGLLNTDQMNWFRKKKAPEELYDLEKDPFELHNVSGDPKYRKDLERLRKIHEAWVKEIDDKGIKYKTEMDLMESMWPQGIQPQTADPVIRIRADKIELSSETDGASIVYQINHAGYHKNHWFLYDKPFESVEGDTITAIAHRIGFMESKEVETVFR